MKLTALQFGFSVSVLTHGLVFSVAPLLRSGHQDPSAALGGNSALELIRIPAETELVDENTPASPPPSVMSTPAAPDEKPPVLTSMTPHQGDAAKAVDSAAPLQQPTQAVLPDNATCLGVTPAEAMAVDKFLETSFAVLTPTSPNHTHYAETDSQDIAESPALLARSSTSHADRSALPSYRYNPKPVYPKDARARRQQGQVIIALAVNADGLPEEAEVNQSSGFGSLDRAALRAVKNWRFLPARDGGRPVPSRVAIPFIFVLPD